MTLDRLRASQRAFFGEQVGGQRRDMRAASPSKTLRDEHSFDRRRDRRCPWLR